jgi:hypothetical protein
MIIIAAGWRERVAPYLQDDFLLNGSNAGSPSALAAEGREAVRKGRQPNPGLPIKRLHPDPTVTDGMAPRLAS